YISLIKKKNSQLRNLMGLNMSLAHYPSFVLHSVKVQFAFQNYFGSAAILRTELEICHVPLSFLTFSYDPEEWIKYWFVLTKTELLAFPTQLHAEISNDSPVFQCPTSSVVSVLRLEDVLSTVSFSPLDRQEEIPQASIDKLGIFVVATISDKWFLKAKNNVSREMWIEHLQKLLSSKDGDTELFLTVPK
ncbi:hypothetical protein RFI_09346, partial [Reticulomyxa filosa]